ncbi:hypothetical protein RHSIM_Rhsim07G0122200 [Rhododendron simsii]|uniref:Uncharacterized protein n=1 Tax=Rhododendron simsii TaxID=118357 RepID=A0A834GUR7_RHOSS|nr:hypothetical protein RHSIM_Rhsim07G0122200 [Rhododendron simsii]
MQDKPVQSRANPKVDDRATQMNEPITDFLPAVVDLAHCLYGCVFFWPLKAISRQPSASAASGANIVDASNHQLVNMQVGVQYLAATPENIN